LPKNLATYVGPEKVTDDDPFAGFGKSDNGTEAPPDLDAARGDIIELWITKGRPVVHLGPGENCEDIEKLLSHSNISPPHVTAINKWYADNGGE
jgi:hypothetical protein